MLLLQKRTHVPFLCYKWAICNISHQHHRQYKGYMFFCNSIEVQFQIPHISANNGVTVNKMSKCSKFSNLLSSYDQSLFLILLLTRSSRFHLEGARWSFTAWTSISTSWHKMGKQLSLFKQEVKSVASIWFLQDEKKITDQNVGHLVCTKRDCIKDSYCKFEHLDYYLSSRYLRVLLRSLHLALALVL